MAGRPKKVVTENTTITEEKVIKTTENKTADNSAEMDSLKKENAELKSQLQSILEKLSLLETKNEENITETVSEETVDVDNYKEINPLKPIKVVSLTDGGVSLRTNSSGSGKTLLEYAAVKIKKSLNKYFKNLNISHLIKEYVKTLTPLHILCKLIF